MADLTYMDCWNFIAPLIPITSDGMTAEIYRSIVCRTPAADVVPVVRCKDCIYYHKENRTCQSKKCATGGSGKVSWIDKLFCSPCKKDGR